MNDLETAIACLFGLVLIVEVIPVIAWLCVLAWIALGEPDARGDAEKDGGRHEA